MHPDRPSVRPGSPRSGRREWPLGLILLAGAVAAWGIGASGSGFSNGDAAVYFVQAAQGDLSQRVVHIGYLAPAALVARGVEDLALALDWASALAGGALVWWTGRRHRGRRAWVAGAVVACAALPLVGFAEVDLHWAALLAASLLGSRGAAALCAGLAVSISPTALLALPWVCAERRDGAAALGGIASALLLWGGSGGAWWSGDRGVWMGPPLRPGRTAEAWLAALPWGAVLAGGVAWSGGRRGMLGGVGKAAALLPLLLAPPDVPTVLILAMALGHGLARMELGKLGLLLVGAQLLVSAHGATQRKAQVVEEAERLARVAAALGPGDGLVAPWSDGVRISVEATGEPYGLVWMPPRGPVRDQGARWCQANPARALVVQGRAASWEAGAHWTDSLGCPEPGLERRGPAPGGARSGIMER